jgi:hypothetical protein
MTRRGPVEYSISQVSTVFSSPAELCSSSAMCVWAGDNKLGSGRESTLTYRYRQVNWQESSDFGRRGYEITSSGGQEIHETSQSS